MADDDGPGGKADGARCFNEGPRTDGQHDRAHHRRHTRRIGNGNRDDDGIKRIPTRGDQRQRQKKGGKSEQNINNGHQRAFQKAARIARNGAQQRADRK